MLYGEENFTYTKGQYVVSCTDIPVSSRVVDATEESPFVVLIWNMFIINDCKFFLEKGNSKKHKK